MRQFRHGLVIGKFYPFHNGHAHLIRTALEQSDKVTVLVYANQYQHIDVDDRVNWIKEEFDEYYTRIRVAGLINDIYDDYVDLNVWEAHDHVLQAKLRQMYPYRDARKIEAIFSSEDYGKQMLDYFPGATSVIVDKPRATYPISGTAARGDLFGNWSLLPIPTRRALIPRIIVVGAESTGTTTLSLALAEHYGGRYVPEYGRQYTIDWLDSMKEARPDADMSDLVWRRQDFERIGKYQTVLENRAAIKIDGFPLVVADTDAFATAIWEDRYLQNEWQVTTRSSYAQTPRRDLYLLTDHVGVEFEDDGYRDGEKIRAEMTKNFEDALTFTGKSWALMRGSHEERMTIATKMVDRVIEERLNFD